MRYQIGDLVRVKNTGEEGKVVKDHGHNMLLINIDGVEFPIFENEVEHPYLNWFLEKKLKPHTKPKHTNDALLSNVPKQAKLASGLKLTFVPEYKKNDDEIIIKVKVFLSNDMHQSFAFNYYFESKSNNKFDMASEVRPFENFYIHDISYEDMATNPFFELSCAEIVASITSTINNYSDAFTIKPKKLFEMVQTMHERNEGFLSIGLINDDEHLQQTVQVPIMPSLDKSTIIERDYSKNDLDAFAIKQIKKEAKKGIKPPAEKPIPIISPEEKIAFKTINVKALFTNPFEIDLHIEKITPHHQNLSNVEKFNLQIEIFEKALDISMLEQKNTLIVIHGEGKGVLRDKIHAILNQTISVHSYVNQLDTRYGLGATEIFFGY
jgi:hypothetical protein